MLIGVYLAALAIVAAVAWLLWRDARGKSARATAAAIAVLGLVGVAATSAWTDDRSRPATDRPEEVRTAEFGYVGSARCRSCHLGEHASWYASYHRRMTQRATPSAILPDVDDVTLGTGRAPTRRTARIRTIDGIPHIDVEHTPTDGFATTESVRQPLALITGSHHFQAFWYPTGHRREMALAPYCYRIDEGLWMPVSAAFLMPPDTEQPLGHGRWNTTCDGCHATGVQRRIGMDGSMDTVVAEFGISCEACHGPGAEHVAHHANPWTRYRAHWAEGEKPDPTIANPKHMSPARSAQVCGQCHSVSMPRRPHYEAWQTTGAPYRPGDDLHRTRRIVTRESRDAPEIRSQVRRDPGFFDSIQWADGMIRVSGREYNGLLESPCFTHGDPERQMTCTSCHALHRGPANPPDRSAAASERAPLAEWRDDQLSPIGRDQRACTQCHEQYRDPEALVAHTHHDASSSGSQCYNCHMSHTTYGLLKAIRSHTITSPSVAAELDTGRPNACNQCHLDQTLAWTAEHLAKRYGIPEPNLDHDQQTVAASALWALTGDAGQRALAAWSFGWEPARAASGLSPLSTPNERAPRTSESDATRQPSAASASGSNDGGAPPTGRHTGPTPSARRDPDWATPIVARLMDDPYHAVRFIAWRSLKTAPRYANFDFDFMAPVDQRRTAISGLTTGWLFDGNPLAPSTLLLRADGTKDAARHTDLLRKRDHRKVFLAE